jgi:hypothetical protein
MALSASSFRKPERSKNAGENDRYFSTPLCHKTVRTQGEQTLFFKIFRKQNTPLRWHLRGAGSG